MSWDKDGTTRPEGADVPTWSAELGTRLRVVVRNLGGNDAAGRIAGVSDEMISRYLNGKAKPSFYTMAALARAADVDLNWLAGLTNDAKRASRHHDTVEFTPSAPSAAEALADPFQSARDRVALVTTLVEGMTEVYRTENARISTVDLVKLAASASERIAAITLKKERWPAVVEMVLDELRDDLRKPPSAENKHRA